MRSENPIGEPFYELSEVDSTNNYAMRQLQAHLAEHGATWFAWFQNSGKGQRGKPWNAEPGQNIMMSSIIEPDILSINNQFFLNVAVALACFDFFNTYTPNETTIKWPNDIYWKDRKAGGILIENIVQGKTWKFSIVGIGININQTLFPGNLPNPVSLTQITGKTFDIIALAKQLCKCLDDRWKQLSNGKSNELLSEYCAHLYKLNEVVSLKKQNSIFTAVIEGVNKQGELIINSADSSTLAFGSVEWILPQLK